MDADFLKELGSVSKKVIFSYDCQNRRFQYLSQAFEQIWETSPQSLLEDPSSLLTMVHPNDRQNVRAYLQKLLNGSAHEEVEFKLLLPDESMKVIWVDAYRIAGDGGQAAVIAGFATDISRQKHHENYLWEFGHRKNSALEIISHDLRGPLAMLQGLANSLENDHKEKNYEEIGNYTRFIHRACEECLTLINELLSDEHLRSPDVQVKKEWIDVVAKTNELAENYRSAPNVTQSVEVQAEPNQIFAELDKVKFMQILNNLITNAIKFTAPDGKITLRVREEERNVVVMVADNGIGIPERLHPYLFEKYSKASRPGLRGEKSRGIGLSIVRDLVEFQRGRIWFESKEQEGTTFYISFPKRD